MLGAAVVVIKNLAIALCVLLLSNIGFAAVLPEDQTEILYHSYSGNGLTIDGPSVLVRKQFKDKVSVWGNYYADNISGASIDLLARGSTFYREEREEKSIGFEYLRDRTIVSISGSNSSERDYEANSVAFSISQEFFGDLTTLSLSYAQGNDEVGQNIYEDQRIIDTIERGDVRRQRFGLGVTQVLTPKWIVAFNSESVIDEGFLNNPYRTVRFLNQDGTQDGTASFQPELYPETRNSDAFAVRSMYYLTWPWRSSIKLEYRIYNDSWGIDASNFEIRYTVPIKERFILETKFRSYEQTAADFYSDLFPRRDAQTFLARDKEMSEFTSNYIGLGFTYKFGKSLFSWMKESSAHLNWDLASFDYENFRQNEATITSEVGAGNEPFLSFDANIFRVFYTVKY